MYQIKNKNGLTDVLPLTENEMTSFLFKMYKNNAYLFEYWAKQSIE